MLLHQNFNNNDLDLIPKLRLQLAYYLQLQDRIEDAQKIFSTVKRTDPDVCPMTYDYMHAYFEFFNAENDDDEKVLDKVAEIRKITKEYVDCPHTEFKKLFKKLNE